MPRRTKLTPEVQDVIVTALRAGNYAETAAAYAGINETTYYRWLARGEEQPDSIYGQFRQAVKEAQAAGEVRLVSLIDRAAQSGTWQAAAWKLERKYPERWGRTIRTEVSGPEGGPVQIEVDPRESLLERLGLTDPENGDTEDDPAAETVPDDDESDDTIDAGTDDP